MRKNSLWILLLLWSSIWLGGCDKEEEWVFFSSEATDATYNGDAAGDTSEEVPSILVYVCGAVENPGVVALETDARVVDAITLAGGMKPEADEDYVNLAAKLTDGEKLYVPTISEVLQWEAEAAEESLVNINTADKETLCTLPGIGESKAEDILAYRNANGSFHSKEELMKVPGIKENLFSKISDKIRVE